ncbi:MAG TPA: 30S ribosomal protein S20 [Dehalococcoidia bacterium]|nr:30S ribosomal protein S20 [Dehalococcoidia bacterium]
MAHTRSARKRIRITLERSRRNRSMRSQSKTYVARADRSIQAGNFGLAEEAVKRAISILDRAAHKGVIHRNSAAHRKSSLMRKLRISGGSDAGG